MIYQNNVGTLKRVIHTQVILDTQIWRRVNHGENMDTDLIKDANMIITINVINYCMGYAEKVDISIYLELKKIIKNK